MTSRLPANTEVLVVGGGPVGLVVSSLLSQRGVPNVVVERRSETQRAPAAHVIRQRPMQILDGIGVGDAVRRAAPVLPLDHITWCATLGGAEIGRLDLRPVDPVTGARPPEPWTNCPQNLLEPILLETARKRPEATVSRGAECTALEPHGECVTARIRIAGSGEQCVEARWAIAADGAGSPTRRALGIAMQGAGPLARLWMVHFAADLSPWIEKRSGPIFWILNPDSPGTLIVHDPKRSHVFMLPMRDDDDESSVAARLSTSLGVAVTPEIRSIDAWSPHVQVAERYRAGRVVLVGDAAHRFPPTGGLGLNTGICEAEVLVERLARARAPEDLDGYEAACRPAARANADESFENLKRLGEIPDVLGACADLASLEARIGSLSAAERERLAGAIEAQRSHFLSEGHAPQTV